MGENEIENTIQYYTGRLQACEQMKAYGERMHLTAVADASAKVADLRSFLTEQGEQWKASERKADLVKRVADHFQGFIMEGAHRAEGYRKQLALLKDVQSRHIMPQLEKGTEKLDACLDQHNSWQECATDVVNYDALTQESTHFTKESDAHVVVDALERNKGQVCLLYGGGGSSLYGGYINKVTKTQVVPKPPHPDKGGFDVQVEMFMLAEPQIRSDWCGIEKGDYTRTPETLVDVKQFTPYIWSWRVACPKQD